VKKTRMGRPVDPKIGRRSKMVKLRMSESEYRKLEAKAKKAGQTVSEFLRDCGKD
jgi:Ribbon-helix-helix protein, copG family